MDDTVTIARQTRLHIVGPVLQRIHDRSKKSEESTWPGTLIEVSKRLQNAAGTLVRHENRIVRTVGMKRPQVDCERGPARQRRVEKMDREVTANAAIGKPTFLRPAIFLVNSPKISRVQRNSTQQNWKTQAQTRRNNDRQILGGW